MAGVFVFPTIDPKAPNNLAVPSNPITKLGQLIRTRVENAGKFAAFAAEVFRALLTAPKHWARWSRLGPQLYFVGTTSVPVLVLIGFFIGAILALESYEVFNQYGQAYAIGGVVNVSMVKQIGPVLAAVMLAGRVGCALTAELGSMRVTDQLDAMRVMGADPVRVLVAPRVAACIFMIPALTSVSNVCGIFGGYFIIVQLYGVPASDYQDFTQWFIDWFDVLSGQVKSVFFGAAIGIIACWKGFTCRAGAVGVGRATTEAFVASFVAIIIINLVLVKFLNDIDLWRLGSQ